MKQCTQCRFSAVCLPLGSGTNNRIPLIWIWRRATGDGLSEAREAVEARMACIPENLKWTQKQYERSGRVGPVAGGRIL